jgi:hypothetical protein
MDSNLNYRHVQVHSAELHRQAELHRLATKARADRKAKPPRQTTFYFPKPLPRIAWIIGRVTAAVRATNRAG